MLLSVGELTRRTGVSARTLHYYDQIGLLRPSQTTAAGYRYYDGEAVALLQQILFYRELDFPLCDIKRILHSPDYDRIEAMKKHRTLLILKRDRMNELIRLTDETLKGESNMSFTSFDSAEIERTRQAYTAEAEARWGHTEAYRQSAEREKGYSDEERARIQAEADDIFLAFANCVREDAAPGSERAQALVGRWQAHISAYHYDCSKPILKCLGQMYTADERFTGNIDRFCDGTAAFIREAIDIYCA